MKRTLLVILAGTSMAASSYGQGTVVFVNSTTNLIYLDYWSGILATADMGVKAQLWYAPVGTTDTFLFQPLASTVNVGVALPGRFIGGTMTIPGVTPAGGSVAAIVRVFIGADWNTAQQRNSGEIFTIDTGDPTTTPAGTPTSTALLGWGPISILIPEPSSMALAGIGAATLLFFRRRK